MIFKGFIFLLCRYHDSLTFRSDPYSLFYLIWVFILYLTRQENDVTEVLFPSDRIKMWPKDIQSRSKLLFAELMFLKLFKLNSLPSRAPCLNLNIDKLDKSVTVIILKQEKFCEGGEPVTPLDVGLLIMQFRRLSLSYLFRISQEKRIHLEA